MKHIGNEIDRIISSNKHFKTKNIAEAVGITSVYLSNIKKKDSIDAHLLAKLAKALDVPISTFFDEKQPTTTNNQVHHGTGDNNIVSAQAHEIELLKDLVAEKERTIQILLDKK